MEFILLVRLRGRSLLDPFPGNIKKAFMFCRLFLILLFVSVFTSTTYSMLGIR